MNYAITINEFMEMILSFIVNRLNGIHRIRFTDEMWTVEGNLVGVWKGVAL